MNNKTKGVVGTIALAILLATCGFSYSATAMIRGDLCTLNGYSDTAMSTFFSFYCVGTAVACFILGKLIGKIGFKKVTIIGAFCPALFILLPFIKSQYVLWILGIVIGFLSQFPGFVTNGIFVNSWFNKGRAFMMMLGLVALNVIGIVGAPVAANLVVKFGVTKYCVGYGIILGAISLLLAIFLVPEAPEKYGMEKVDIMRGKPEKEEKKPAATLDTYQPKVPAVKMLALPAVLVLLIIPALMSFTMTLFTSNPMAALQSFGIDYITASYCFSVAQIFSIITSLVFGGMCDKIGTKWSVVILAGLNAVGIVVATMFVGLAGAIICSIFVMFISVAVNNYVSLVSPEMFGEKQSVSLISWAGFVQNVAGIFSPIAASLIIVAANGNYKILFVVSALLYAVVILGNLFIMSKGTKKRVKALDEKYLQSISNAG